MKKSIIEKSKKLKSMYVTVCPIYSTDEDYGYKYFIVFHHTHKIVSRHKTQKDLEIKLDDILEDGIIQDSAIFY